MSEILKIKNLTKYYGKNIGVKNISLDINKGEIFGFIGPNGAGKSTTIKCILNLLEYSGEISVSGRVLTTNDMEYKKNIGYLPSEVELYEDMKVIDVIKYSDTFYKESHMKYALELSTRLEVPLKKRVDELSFGNLKKVGIVLALMHKPKLLILDEPTSGLDPLMQEVFFDILLEEKKRGTTIFFSSHVLTEVKKVCDRVGIIKDGSIVEVSDIKSLLNKNFSIITIKSKDVKKLKLGVNAQIKSVKGDEMVFVYHDDINKLIKQLSEVDIKNILIEEPTIEEIFMHYYREDKNV